MALDLFKRVETRKGLFAVEKITLIYNLLTSILILFLFQEMDHPVQMLADRVVIAGMTFLLMYLYRLAPCKFSAFVRIAIQMSLLSYWYPDTFEFNRIFPNLDHVFASVEQWMFGGQPAVWFCERFPQMWVSEPFNMGYFFYYPMILLVVVWYFLYRFDLFEKVSFVIVTAFFIYYLIYIFVPVAGPQFYFPPLEATMWRKVSSRPSVIISITIRNFFPVRAMSTASSTTWWRVPSRWVSAPRLLFPVRTSECLRY